MLIECDPAKDAVNRDKHGISLGEAARIDWDNAVTWPDRRVDYGEDRMRGLGYIGERLYFVAFVDRGQVRRVISAACDQSSQSQHEGVQRLCTLP